MSKKKKDTYYLRVRVTYEDVVEVKAKDFHEAQCKAEQYVFDNMNDVIESTTEIEEWSDEFHH